MKNEKKIMSLGIIIIIGFAMQAAGQYKNVALNPADVRAPGHGFPHASSNSEYPCIYPADTSGGNHCTPDTTFLALDAINGDTNNASHGSMAFASWGPQLTVPGLWWKVDFGHDVSVDKVKIWVRADWAGNPSHDSYWKRATLVFSNGSRDTIFIDSLRTGQEFTFVSRITQSVTTTDFVASNPAKWCAFTEVQVWGYDPPTSVSNPTRSAIIAGKDKGGLFCYLPGLYSLLPALPTHAAGAELYTIQGKKILTFNRKKKGSPMNVQVPAGLSRGIYQIKYY
jgi:hypothetical protein